MLKDLRNFVGNYLRGFRGLYENRVDRFEDLPLSESSHKSVLGETVEGREIFAYHFAQGAPLKILFMAGIHGNEVGTVKLMHKLVNFLNGRKAFMGVDVFVLPCLNLDGLAKAVEEPDYLHGGKVGRLNANGVDLNRNFASKNFESENQWYFGNKYRRVYCGDEPFSEPETRGLADFIEREKIQVIYSFHSRGEEVCGSKDRLAQELVKDFAKKSGYRYVSDEDWSKLHLTGTMKEWCEEKGLSYVEVECGSRWASGWEDQREAIISAIKYHYG